MGTLLYILCYYIHYITTRPLYNKMPKGAGLRHGPGPGVRDDQTSEGSPHLLDCDVARICFGNVFSGDCTRLVTIDFYRLVPKFAGIRLNWINNVKWTWTLIRRIHWMW